MILPRFLLLASLAVALVPAALAQDETCILPPGEVGTPYLYDFGVGQLDPNDFEDIEFSIQFTAQAPQALPPGVIVKPLGQIVGVPTAPGVFVFTLIYGYHLSFEGFSQDFDFPFTCSITVAGTVGPPLRVTPGGLTFSVLQGGGAVSQSVVISNASTAAQNIGAVALPGAPWLSTTLTATAFPAYGDRILTVSVNPSQVSIGTHLGAIRVTAAQSGVTVDIPVVVTVSSSGQSIQLSQTGLLFRAGAGGGSPPAQTVRVSPASNVTLNYTAAVSTNSGGQWLSVSPAGGAAQPGVGATLTVQANPGVLSPGDYYGSVRITSANADNSPQVITVVLSISAANGPIEPQVQPFGLIFVGRAGAPNPSPRSIQVSNPSTAPVNYTPVRSFENGTNWFTVTPASGAATPNLPGTIQVQPLLVGLAPGVYRGTVSIHFDELNSARHVTVLLIVLPPASGASVRGAAGCTPTKLLPVFTLIGAGFTNAAGWPASLGLTVVDDCGDPMTAGSVLASFSNGDPPLPLLPGGEGTWTATWEPQTLRAQVSITIRAQQTSPALAGTETISGKLQQNPHVPSVTSGGVVSSASFAALQPVAPGGFISIFGEELADGLLLTDKLPYTAQLGTTQVLLGGRELPLQFIAGSVVNAIVPYDTPPNSTQQLVVIRGGAISLPRPVVVADAQPAIFTQNVTGKGLGVIVVIRDGVTPFLISASQPAKAGDVLLIYAAGLGRVSPPVPAGAPAPFTQVSRTDNPLTITIGGIPSPTEFAGLAPGYPGVYQVNVRVPAGITPSAEVPIILTVAGHSSPPVTIAVQ